MYIAHIGINYINVMVFILCCGILYVYINCYFFLPYIYRSNASVVAYITYCRYNYNMY